MEPRNRKSISGMEIIFMFIFTIACTTAGWFANAYVDARDNARDLSHQLQQCHDSRVELSDQNGYNRGLYSLNTMRTEADLETLPEN